MTLKVQDIKVGDCDGLTVNPARDRAAAPAPCRRPAIRTIKAGAFTSELHLCSTHYTRQLRDWATWRNANLQGGE